MLRQSVTTGRQLHVPHLRFVSHVKLWENLRRVTITQMLRVLLPAHVTTAATLREVLSVTLGLKQLAMLLRLVPYVRLPRARLLLTITLL